MYLNHHGGLFQIEKNSFPTLIGFRSFYSHFFKVPGENLYPLNTTLGVFFDFFCLFFYIKAVKCGGGDTGPLTGVFPSG